MSFFSDLFSGNLGNLGQDLAPSNIFADFGTDVSKAVSNPAVDIGAGVGLGLLTGGLGDLLGGALLPTVGEGVLGLEAGAAAPASLGAALGGAGDIAGLDTGATALGYGETPTFVPNPIGPDFQAVAGPGAGLSPPGMNLAATAAGNASELTPAYAGFGPTPDLGGWMGDINPTNAPGLFAQPSMDTGVVAGGSNAPIDVTGTLGPGGPVPNAPTTLTAPGAAPPSSPGGLMGALKTAGGFAKDIAPVAGLAGLGLTGFNAYQEKQALAKTSQQEATAAGQAAQTAQQTQAAAAPLVTSGETLMNYLTTGTLPPEFQAQVQQQVDAMKAQIIQGYGARGMSTNPAQNSALAQDLANADLQAESLRANLESTLSTAGNQMVTTANNMLATGLNATQLSAQIPIMMQNLNTQLAAETSKALASFATAMNSGGGTGQKVTLSVAA